MCFRLSLSYFTTITSAWLKDALRGSTRFKQYSLISILGLKISFCFLFPGPSSHWEDGLDTTMRKRKYPQQTAAWLFLFTSESVKALTAHMTTWHPKKKSQLTSVQDPDWGHVDPLYCCVVLWFLLYFSWDLYLCPRLLLSFLTCKLPLNTTLKQIFQSFCIPPTQALCPPMSLFYCIHDNVNSSKQISHCVSDLNHFTANFQILLPWLPHIRTVLWSRLLCVTETMQISTIYTASNNGYWKKRTNCCQK